MPNRFPTIELDDFVIMPNHVHGIIVLDEELTGSQTAPTLATVVRAFKSISGIEGNRALGRTDRPFWQRNYHDRIICDDLELAAIRRYIAENPARWEHDTDNPERSAHS